MSDVRIVRTELQGFPISVSRFLMPPQAGQGVALQTEHAGIGDTGHSGFLRLGNRGLEVTTANAEQNGSGA